MIDQRLQELREMEAEQERQAWKEEQEKEVRKQYEMEQSEISYLQAENAELKQLIKELVEGLEFSLRELHSIAHERNVDKVQIRKIEKALTRAKAHVL